VLDILKKMSPAQRKRLLSREIWYVRKWRDDVLRDAQRGDCAPLAEYIRKGGRITPAMRPFLIEALRKKRPGKKVALASTRERDRALVGFVLSLRRRGDRGALKKAEQVFGRTLRHIKKILARHKGGKVEPSAEAYLALMKQIKSAERARAACRYVIRKRR